MYLRLLIFLTAIWLCNLPLSRQDQAQSGNANPPPSFPSSNLDISQVKIDEENSIKTYQDSDLYVANYDPNIKSLPDAQLAFLRNMIADDMEFYRTILREAIDKRNNFAPSVQLIFKYVGKLLGNFIQARQKEKLLTERKQVDPSFFGLMADLLDSIIKRSDSIIKEKSYSKKTVDATDLSRRLDNMLNYVKRIVDASPTAIYVRWDQAILFKNDLSNPQHDTSFAEETADVLAVSSRSLPL